MAADIVIDTVALPDAVVWVPYEAAIAYHGNATALSAMSVSAGSLPPGLVVDSALPFCRITGTPTAAGTFTFRVSLTDTAGVTQSPQYTIRVNTANIDGRNWPASAWVKQEWPLS